MPTASPDSAALLPGSGQAPGGPGAGLKRKGRAAAGPQHAAADSPGQKGAQASPGFASALRQRREAQRPSAADTTPLSAPSPERAPLHAVNAKAEIGAAKRTKPDPLDPAEAATRPDAGAALQAAGQIVVPVAVTAAPTAQATSDQTTAPALALEAATATAPGAGAEAAVSAQAAQLGQPSSAQARPRAAPHPGDGAAASQVAALGSAADTPAAQTEGAAGAVAVSAASQAGNRASAQTTTQAHSQGTLAAAAQTMDPVTLATTQAETRQALAARVAGLDARRPARPAAGRDTGEGAAANTPQATTQSARQPIAEIARASLTALESAAPPLRSAQQMKAETAPSVLSAWASGQRAAAAPSSAPLPARSSTAPAASALTPGESLSAALAALNSPPAAATSVFSDRSVLHGHISTPVSSPEFHASLASSVSGLLRQGGQAQFSLNPAEMGPITVKVDLQGDQARVSFAADVASTRELLEKSQPWLSQAMGEAGLRLVQTHIAAPASTPDPRGQAFQQPAGQQGQPQQQPSGGNADAGSFGASSGQQASTGGQPHNPRQAPGTPVPAAPVADTVRSDSPPPSSNGRGLHTVV
ncbi:flagellar hook-length control protein FliK [Amphibiibacter pelophylacis]|uniref:Flagellar hook-length control protein FliK n=1 Tax=Amphibiibacter pelophylacis TaxID=1799477 RepID=A0ACC6NZR8_9BURK